MTSFKTLLLREWYQHRLGWMVIVAAPLFIALLALLVGHVTVNVNDTDVVLDFGRAPALALATAAIVGTGVLSFVLAWFSACCSRPGWRAVINRDRVDRVLAVAAGGRLRRCRHRCWCSLFCFRWRRWAWACWPDIWSRCCSSHVSSAWGSGFSLPWGLIALAWLSTMLRTALGLVLATIWLSPLILLVMAASAWLKRWGIPALAIGLVVLANLLDKVFGYRAVWDLGRELMINVGRSFVYGASPGGMRFTPTSNQIKVLRAYPSWRPATPGIRCRRWTARCCCWHWRSAPSALACWCGAESAAEDKKAPRPNQAATPKASPAGGCQPPRR